MSTEKEPQRIKVRVDVTLLVDVDAWSTDYGTEGAKEVRADVQQYVRTLLQECEAGSRWAWQVL